MTDREKIISIIEQNKYCDVNTTANCRECRYNKELANYKDMGCSSLKTADALISAGIGDVTEWKERAEKHRFMALPDGRIKQLYSDKEVEQIVKERDEYKHRAEVAERAFDNTIKAFHETLSALFPDTKVDLDKWKKNNLANAEKELAEEG